MRTITCRFPVCLNLKPLCHINGILCFICTCMSARQMLKMPKIGLIQLRIQLKVFYKCEYRA